MTFFRSHITRFSGALVLLVSMVLYFINPASDKVRHEAFASWLESHLKTQEASGVRDQINELASYDGELGSVIKKASELVTNNSDDFELPISDNSSDENEVFRLLLTEWNTYQNTSGGMAKAVIIEHAKTHTVLPNDALALANKALLQQEASQHLPARDRKYTKTEFTNFYITPLSGGTSIGAP